MAVVMRAASFSPPHSEGMRSGPFHALRRMAASPPARARVLRIAWLTVCLPCSIADVAALDLSLPQDVAGEGPLIPMSGPGAPTGKEYRRTEHSAALALYTDNVKETIRRRLGNSFPRDAYGRAICGEANYAMALRPDGSIDRLEVAPVRKYVVPSGNLETYFVQPMPAHRNAGSATYTRPVATDKEELQTFAQKIAELLRSLAPFAAQPEGRTDHPSPAQPVLVTGNIGVECRKWEAAP